MVIGAVITAAGLMGRLFGGVIDEVMAGPESADEAAFTAFLNH